MKVYYNKKTDACFAPVLRSGLRCLPYKTCRLDTKQAAFSKINRQSTSFNMFFLGGGIFML